jgi:ankyrin repeat protein
MVKTLLKMGVSKEVKSGSGDTALSLAKKSKLTSIINVLSRK